MNGNEIAKAITERIKAVCPESFIKVEFTYSLYPSIWLTFAKGGDRKQWSNGIIQNDPFFLTADINGFVQAEYLKRTDEIKAGVLATGKVKLEVHSNNNHRVLPLRGKTATPEKMIDYLEKYFIEVQAGTEFRKVTA
jgi:hypothetical protein